MRLEIDGKAYEPLPENIDLESIMKEDKRTRDATLRQIVAATKKTLGLIEPEEKPKGKRV